MALTLSTAPAFDPITIDEAKEHLQLLNDDDDMYVRSLIKAATAVCETYLRQSIATQTWVETFPSFPASGCIPLQRPPLASVTSVQYVDTDGATQTLSTSLYAVDTSSQPGRIIKAYNASWPNTRSESEGASAPVTVTFIAGNAKADIPDAIKHAIKLLIGHWFVNREEVSDRPGAPIPKGAIACLATADHGSYP